MLAQLAVDLAVVPKAHFVGVGPRLNRRVATAFRLYANQLGEPSHEENRVSFSAITLEAVVEAIAEAGAVELGRTLWLRYLDFQRVLECALTLGPPTADTAPSAHIRKPLKRP